MMNPRSRTLFLGVFAIVFFVSAMHLLVPPATGHAPELAPPEPIAAPGAEPTARMNGVLHAQRMARTSVLPVEAVVAAADERLTLVARTRAEVILLEKQQPEEFLAAVIPPEGHASFDAASAERARRHVRAYVQDRTEVLRSMSLAYVQSDGEYDFQADLDRLAEIDDEFRRDVADLKERLPQLEQIPEVLGSTALPLPTFAREAEQLARGGGVVEYVDAEATEAAPGE